MSNSSHPTYPFPPIQEALCEIHFRLADRAEWQSAFFGEFFKRLQPDFPVLEPVMQVGVQLQIGPSGVGQSILPPQQRMRYKHGDRPLVIQLSGSVLTVNELPPYPGWEQMKADVRSAWEKAVAVVSPAWVSRIGLRYINRIRREHRDETPGDWLKASDYLPPAILSSAPGFIYRIETRDNQGQRQIVALGETVATREGALQDIVFDLDCIVEGNLGLTISELERHLMPLHERAWSVFAASMTERLEASMLKGVNA